MISRIIPFEPKSLWVEHFGHRLVALVRGMTNSEAEMHGCEAFEDSADFPPQDAAEVFALELPPGGGSEL